MIKLEKNTQITQYANKQNNSFNLTNLSQSGTYGCRITWSPTPGSTNTSSCRLEVRARAGLAVTPPLRARAVRAATLPASLHLSPPPALAARLDVVGTAEVLEQLSVRRLDTPICKQIEQMRLIEVQSVFFATNR